MLQFFGFGQRFRIGMPVAKLLGVTLAFLLPVSASAQPGTMTWTGYLYQGPGNTYVVIDELKQGTSLAVDSCADGWCKVVIGAHIGYLRSQIVSRGTQDPAGPPLHQPAFAGKGEPKGPCLDSTQTGGNGGAMRTRICLD